MRAQKEDYGTILEFSVWRDGSPEVTANCEKADLGDYDYLFPGLGKTVTINGVTLYGFGRLEVGMSRSRLTYGYKILRNNACYLFEVMVATANALDQPPKNYSQEEQSTLLKSEISTFKFVK